MPLAESPSGATRHSGHTNIRQSSQTLDHCLYIFGLFHGCLQNLKPPSPVQPNFGQRMKHLKANKHATYRLLRWRNCISTRTWYIRQRVYSHNSASRLSEYTFRIYFLILQLRVGSHLPELEYCFHFSGCTFSDFNNSNRRMNSSCGCWVVPGQTGIVAEKVAVTYQPFVVEFYWQECCLLLDQKIFFYRNIQFFANLLIFCFRPY